MPAFDASWAGEILTLNLEANSLTWLLGPDGVWRREPQTGLPSSHERFQGLARHRAIADDKSLSRAAS